MNNKCLTTCPPDGIYALFFFGLFMIFMHITVDTHSHYLAFVPFSWLFFSILCTLKMGLSTKASNANSKAIIHLPSAVIVAISRNAVSTPENISFVMSFVNRFRNFTVYRFKMFQSNTITHWSVLKLQGKKAAL